MSDNEDDMEVDAAPSVKRFKYKSYNAELKDVHLPAALSGQSKIDEELEDTQSHFYEALLHWQQLNLSPSFIKFSQKSASLSSTLPLLLHNWHEIVNLWLEAQAASDDEGLKALLDLLQKIFQDLRLTLAPVYPELLDRLLQLATRSISTDALTVLLSTLSALFKYLVLPSTDSILLEQAWSTFRKILPKCLAEIQRALAEVWGSVLRRLKASLRAKAVVLIAEDLEGIDDAAAWCFVSACKSVSQTLHTVTPTLFSPLLEFHLSCADSEASYTLIRRVLTAFIHHVKGSDQFLPVADIIVREYAKLTSEVTEGNEEKLRRLLEVAAVPASVRNGSRLTPSNITELYALTMKVPVPVSNFLHPSMLKFTSALLTTGDLSLWMSSGRNLLSRLWNDGKDSKFCLELHGILAEMKWGGWKSLALPGLLKRTGKLLEDEPSGTVRLLASLCRDGKLGEVDLVWKKKIADWVFVRLDEMSQNDGVGFDEEKGAELNDVMALSGFFTPKISHLLVVIADKHIESAPLGSGEVDAFPHPAWVINVCLCCLATRPVVEWAQHVNLAQWARSGAEKWSWSRHVLEGLVELATVCEPTTSTLSFAESYELLKDAVLSHSHSLRLNALKFLSSQFVTVPLDTREVLERCVQGEQVSLDVQGIRERVVKLRRVSQVLKNDDERGADLCARWLTAQFKVNLRPLWSPAAAALSELSQRCGDAVWMVLFQELKIVSLEASAYPEKKRSQERTSGEGRISNPEDPWEEERTWRDPSAHKLRDTVICWLDHRSSWRRISDMSKGSDRLEKRSYETQLLHAFEECHSLAEKHNRELIALFLEIAGPVTESKLPRTKLDAWLSLFSKFYNPKALHATETLHALYTTLLSYPDHTLQSLALSCLFTYKQRSLSLYENKLRSLLDDTRWRDELTSLDISAIEPQDRVEVVGVVIRLLFGIMLEKKGRSRGADRRSAVLHALAGCTDGELHILVDLMLRPLTEGQSLKSGNVIFQQTSNEASDRQLVGYLTLLGDVLKNLGSRLVKYWDALLGTTMDIITKAQSRIDGNDSESDVGDGDDETTLPATKLLRSIRQLGLKRLADFCRCPAEFNFAPYMRAAFTAFISPRIPMLDRENTQAPSALLELFYVWTLDSDQMHFLVEYDPQVVPKIFSCLTAVNVKPAVISRIFDIVDRLIAVSADNEEVLETILRPNVSILLSNLSGLVEHSKGVSSVATPLGQRQIGILSQIAQYSTNADEASTLLRLFLPLLRKPPRLVSEKIKVDLLKIIGHQMRLIPDLRNVASEEYQNLYEMLSMLFQSLRSHQARLNLVNTFHDLAEIHVSLQDLAQLLESLNSYSTKRIDVPDFERRLEAFSRLNESLYRTLTISEWLPVLYNMLNLIQDPEELAIRNNASFSMRHFVDFVAARTSAEHEKIFSRVLYPGLKNGLKLKNEVIRAESLGVIAYAVTKCESIGSLQDMKALLANGDEEANFFNNIHHIQLHRRSRALRRLADQCDERPLRNSTLTDILIPLISNYIVETSSLDHHLVNDSINTTGRLAKHLSWKSYNALVQKYIRLSKARDEKERVYVRTMVAILENFPFVMEDEVHEDVVTDERAAEEGEDEVVGAGEPDSTMHSRIADAVNLHLLPTLLTYLESRDATTEDTTRIPIAVGVVKVARNLPLTSAQLQITRLLTTTSQILRSKSQETRDLTRDTLCRIAVVLGSDYLALIIRELRAALLRGPHLHILATTVHHIIAHVTEGEHKENFSVFDDCVPEIAHVSSEVIFGESGKDVQAEGFKTKLREVKSSSSKSLNSFHITAKHVVPSRISALLLPLRGIMQETGSIKVMQSVEDVLKQISSGLQSNQNLLPTDLLSLCHSLITQNSRFLQQAAPRRKHLVKDDAIVQTKRQAAVHTDHFTNNSFRFVVFGLELLNTALRRNKFNFQDSAVLSRLESMIVAVGNTLYSTSSAVLTSGLKTVAGLVKCPLIALERSLPVYIRQTLDILKQLGTTESEVAQTALKTLSSVFRDGPAVDVKEKDLTFLLELVTPDLEEPSRQNSVFAILRAVIARKFVVPEIYDIMDKVTEVLVTNQSSQVQELCRSVLLQFLLDYPQGKGRLRNQITFLTKNLSYEYESGRKSVMEFLGAIISKFQVGLIREYSDLLFVALVMVLANDDSTKCREMAAHLVKSLIERLDDEKRTELMSHLYTWSSQCTQPALVCVSAQVYGLTIDALQGNVSPFKLFILEAVRQTLEHGAEQLEAFEDDSMDIDLEWRLPYHSLIALAKLVKVFPELVRQPEMSWDLVVKYLLFPHAWVRTASSRLLGTLFGSVPVQAPSTVDDLLPLTTSGMKDISAKLCLQLKSEHLDDALSLQTVKNLFFIGKCYAAIPFPTGEMSDITSEDDAHGNDTSEHTSHPLPWMFSTLSYQIRSALIAKRNHPSSRPNWFHQPFAVLRWLAALASFLNATILEQFLVHILSPIYRITEDDTIHDTKMMELKDTAVELRDLVQSKVGTTKFSAVYSQIRQNIIAVQRERKEARVLQIATNPQATANRKAHKNVTRKESRKRKNQIFADGKGKLKRQRED